jgi:hypothetical protein
MTNDMDTWRAAELIRRNPARIAATIEELQRGKRPGETVN